MHYNVFADAKSEAVRAEDNVFATFLQTKGLYDTIAITAENIGDFITLLNGQVRISSYCKECKAERVFTMSPYVIYRMDRGEYEQQSLAKEIDTLQKLIYSPQELQKKGEEWRWKNWQLEAEARVLVFQYVCSMNEEHHLDYVVLVDNKSMRKIGQYPSVADLTFPELDAYEKVLAKEDRKEFGRAIGLYASGIGAGSYVYLRRIFERLLMQAKSNAGDAIDSDAFNHARVDEKITMLSAYLPAALTSNPTLYGILSKGIHELSENECIAYFPVVKECIYMILNEWEDMRKKEEQQRAINAALSKIATNITT